MKKLLLFLTFAVMSVGANAFFDIHFYSGASQSYGSPILDIAHDGNKLYVAKNNGLLVIDKATGTCTLYSENDQTLPGGIASLCVHNDTLWIGCGGGVLASLYKESLNHKRYDVESWGVSGAQISNIAFDSRGTMYLAEQNGFIIEVHPDGSTKGLENFNAAFSGFNCHMLTDGADVLWASNENSFAWYHTLNKYSAGAEEMEPVFPFTAEPTGKCFALALSPEGKVCSSMSGQRFVWMEEGRPVIQTYSSDAPSYFVDMQFTSDGTLWAVSDDGLWSYRDGLFTAHPYPGAFNHGLCLDIDGDVIYIGTADKLLKFHDGEFSDVDLAPNHTVTAIEAVPHQVAPAAAELFDLQGRPISGTPRDVYIQNGRKRLNRK